MPGLVPGIHVFIFCCGKDVNGRDKPGHDAAVLSSRRDFHIQRGGHLQPFDLDSLVAPRSALLFRNRPPGRISQPKPQKMAPPIELRPVFKSAAAVQRHLIAKKLNVALLELDVGGEFGDGVAIHRIASFCSGVSGGTPGSRSTFSIVEPAPMALK